MLLSRIIHRDGLPLRKSVPLIYLALLLTAGILAAPGSSPQALCSNIHPLWLIPEEQVCPGIVTDGDPGVADNGTELYELINGGSTVYIDHGFVAGVLQNWLVTIGGESTWGTMLITNQGTFENAQALFHDPDIAEGELVDGWPFEGEARRHVFFTTKLQLYHQCFFISMEVGSSEPEAWDAAYCLASYMITVIDGIPVSDSSWSLIKSLYH